MAAHAVESRPPRPSSRQDFEIAIICALTLEADAVDFLFDFHWDDDGLPFDKEAGDPNAYSTGAIGRHNVVLAHMPSMGKASAAIVANNCRTSFRNIKLALVVGVCGVVPFSPGKEEIILGDVVVSDGIIQYDLGQQLPNRFVRKNMLQESFGRPNTEIRALMTKLKGLRAGTLLRSKMADYLNIIRREPKLHAEYPGTNYDRLFESSYSHLGDKESCEQLGCRGDLVPRSRLQTDQDNPKPVVHFGLVASGDSVIKSGESRDAISAAEEGVIAFEMEGAGVWESFPCVVIKGACDYADSHKSKVWQRYAAATAAACMKVFLSQWVPFSTSVACPPRHEDQQMTLAAKYLIPYTSNPDFVGRSDILDRLKLQLGHTRQMNSTSQARASLFGLGGVGKTQIALAYVFWLQETYPAISIFWVHASSAERFRQAYTSIAEEYRIPGYDEPKVNVLPLVKAWLNSKSSGQWLMVIDNADDTELFFQPSPTSASGEGTLGNYIPFSAHGSVLITTRNKQAGSRLIWGKRPIEVGQMDGSDAVELVRTALENEDISAEEALLLSSRLEHLPLAVVQAAAFINGNTISIGDYVQLLDESDQSLVERLSEPFEPIGRDSETPHAVAATWIISFEQIERRHAFAAEILSLISIFDRELIPKSFISDYCKRLKSQHRKSDASEAAELVKALGTLKAFSFITEAKNQSVDMHRLVQLVTRKWLLTKGKMSEFSEHALKVVSRAFPFGQFESRQLCMEYLPHAYAVLGNEIPNSRDAEVAKASLLHCMAGYFRYQGRWKDAESLELLVAEATKKMLGDTHPDTLASINNLASTYLNQERWKEAEELYIQVTHRTREMVGDDHPDMLVSMNNLASTVRCQGRWNEAEELGKRVMERMKRVLGDEHHDTLASINNLALTYRHLGRWREAEELYAQVMGTMRRVLGHKHPDTLTSMNNLAWIWKWQGRSDAALKLMRQCALSRYQILGRNHPHTRQTLNTLGEWRKLGNGL